MVSLLPLDGRRIVRHRRAKFTTAPKSVTPFVTGSFAGSFPGLFAGLPPHKTLAEQETGA